MQLPEEQKQQVAKDSLKQPVPPDLLQYEGVLYGGSGHVPPVAMIP